MDFLYKDIDYCRYIINNNKMVNFSNFYSDCKKLCAYYRKIESLQKNEIRYKLLDFFTTRFGYNTEIEEYVNKVINNYNIQLIQIEKISIDIKVLDYITNLDISYESKKILFSMIAYCATMHKFIYEYKNINLDYYFIPKNMSYKKIYDLSNVKYNNKNLKYINELINKDLIQVYSNNNIGIKCIDSINTDNISTFDIHYFNKDYGYYYDYYIGKNIKFCEICGMPFRPKAKNGKYCKEHQGYQPVNDIKTKIITCMDCGKEIEIDARNNTKTRCDECYKIYRREKVKEAKAKWKINQNKE